MENKVLLSVRGLTIGHEGRTLCSGITFDICKGDCIMLCGANGSGKTTLMKALSNATHIHPVDAECIMIPARIPKITGFTLKEFVRVSCFAQSDLYGRLSSAEENSLDQAIAKLGLSHLADRDISTLSDGEFQKASIASALVRKAEVIMLDEPTAFLDAENRISVLNTLRALCGETSHTGTGQRPAIIFSTHDLHDGLQACTKVFALGADGQFYCSTDSAPESKAATVSHIFSR
jgi:iron complex transport system ATP-binding protein